MISSLDALRQCGVISTAHSRKSAWSICSIALTKATGFPLYELWHRTPTVGEAIVRYLQRARPRSSYREIFLTVEAPIRPLSCAAVWRIVARRARALHPPVVPHGVHTLRHACATHLLEQGFSLKEIGDHLGHRNLNSTSLYASVNLTRLREVANLSLGGLL